MLNERKKKEKNVPNVQVNTLSYSANLNKQQQRVRAGHTENRIFAFYNKRTCIFTLINTWN